MADNNQPTLKSSLDDREKEAVTKQKEAEARKATAEAEKAEAEAKQVKLKAQIPSGEAKPVEGKITTDEKAGYVATLAAYNTMIQKAADIAEKINSLSLEKAHLLIVDSLDFCSSDVQLLQISKQIGFWDSELGDQVKRIPELKDKITKIITAARQPETSLAEGKKGKAFGAIEGVGAGLSTARGFVSSIADIIGYFRVDYDIKGQTINLSNIALQSLVAGRIDTKKYSVYLPGFHRILSPEEIGVIKNFDQCIYKKDQLKVKMTELKESLSDPQVGKKKKDGTTEEKNVISEAEKAYEKAETLIKEFAEFNKALTSVPQGGSYSPLAGAAIRQYLETVGITHLLYLTVTSGGGEMVTGKGLFYWGKVGFLGGCVVTYILANISGEIISANTIFGYSSVKYNLCQNKLTAFNNPILDNPSP